MKIAIHHRQGSFSDRWIEYCKKNNIPFLIINCFNNNIIQILREKKITHLMWHINHASSKDNMVFPYVLNAADKMGIKTFPDFYTRWYFDDKIAQKYLLESIDAPIIKSDVFYTKDNAIKFIKKTNLPIVGKLKRGAGATNVFLLNSLEEANLYINKMFTVGMLSTSQATSNLNQKIRIAKRIKNPLSLVKKIFKFLKRNKNERLLTNSEKGYAYFQEFLPDNDYDTRVIVIGDIAFAIRRFNRNRDFRASGSGKIDYSSKKIDKDILKIALNISKNINSQCLAYDFIYKNGTPKIIEISFGFSMNSYDKCEGYWDKDLNFHNISFNPQSMMIENFIKN